MTSQLCYSGDFTIGIDPGLSGAIAILPHDPAVAPVIADMPVRPYGEKGFVKRAVDVDALADILKPYSVIGDTQAYLERVNAFPGQGSASMFSLGMSYWGVAGVLAALKIPLHLVEPKEWKGHFGLAKDKELARALALRYYPGMELTRKKDHNRAEALLIARYGREGK